MKKLFLAALMVALSGVGVMFQPSMTQASDLRTNLSGRILIAVEAKGEAWYVNPVNKQKYFLGTPYEAFYIMKSVALGITNKDYDSFVYKVPSRLAGRILLKVEDSGMAYYVNPVNLKMYYLGRPADAFKIMRQLGLGITNANLTKVPSFADGRIPPVDRTIQIEGLRFNPQSLTISRGSTIIWLNNGGLVHDVVLSNGVNSGNIPIGQSFTHTFNEVGTYTYNCSVHPNMTGTIIVR